ncbi:putative transcription factor MYC/MYB [Lupinus albus]|uniref:Transcription factor n=1 Tax=Lupinus albus TaxID=3870 RepID=A0A6A4Q2C4_LUPAL|nr:putative transcription factor MYC/MYB [Lupinus albus]
MSMTQSFIYRDSLLGQAFFNCSPIWVAGTDRLSTLVCIPTPNGVVELGSIDFIFQNIDLMNNVTVLFNFDNNLNSRSFSQSNPRASIKVLNNHANVSTSIGKMTTLQFETSGFSSLNETISVVDISNNTHTQQQNHNQSLFLRELKILSSLKLESGEILRFGERKKSFYNNVASEENMKRSPVSRSSIDDEMLSFTPVVILLPSNVKSDDVDSDHSDLEASMVKEAYSNKVAEADEWQRGAIESC